MSVIFHKLIKNDLRAALAYYDSEGGSKLGDRFFDDVEDTIARVVQNPSHYHYADDGLRRAALGEFPYHFLYEEYDETIHFLVLRHDKRHPRFGLRRQRTFQS
jgi:plasmid stabilization system protein ParE